MITNYLSIMLMFYVGNIQPLELTNWTIIYYAAGSNSSESDLLNDVAEMKLGKKSDDYNLILLIDRIEGFSEDAISLDGNFTDTRLYQIGPNSYKRLNGEEFFPEIKIGNSYEANMADAGTLKKYIQYCKKYYPAKNYMLVIRSHGNGMGMCADDEGDKRDKLYPAEMTNVLGQSESVDILGLDVCSMAGLENLYQWRPGNNAFSARYVIASSPLSGAWAYNKILERLGSDTKSDSEAETNYFEGGIEENLDPSKMTAEAFSRLVLEEIHDDQPWGCWGLFDNSKIEELKRTIDLTSRLLVKDDIAAIKKVIENTLAYYYNVSDNMELAKLTFPYIDAYHFWYQISTDTAFSNNTRKQAKEVCLLIDELVMLSYYGNGYFPVNDNFKNGKSGVYQIIPHGDAIYSQTNHSFWSHCGWFHPNDTSSSQDSYGQYDWCRDGAIEANLRVDNFYELLDFMFDSRNDANGGVNNYQW